MSTYILRFIIVLLNLQLVSFCSVFFYTRFKHLPGTPSIPFLIGVFVATASLFVYLSPQLAAARRARAGITPLGDGAPNSAASLILACVSLACFGYGLPSAYTLFLAH